MQVFETTDYRQYLFEALGGNKRTGKRQKLSEYLGCQSAHLSQVFSGKNNLSLEFALKTSVFLNLNDFESDYFINLVHIGNSGTLDLKNYYLQKNLEIKKNALDIKKSLKSKSTELSPINQATYYSDALYALIHVAVSLPHIKTASDLKSLLNIEFEEINRILNFLKSIDLIEVNSNGELTTGRSHTYLDKKSPLLKNHHFNLRRHAKEKISKGLVDHNIHYATYYTISKKDFEVIRKKIVELIDENIKIAQPSSEEILCCNVIDFFEI